MKSEERTEGAVSKLSEEERMEGAVSKLSEEERTGESAS